MSNTSPLAHITITILVVIAVFSIFKFLSSKDITIQDPIINDSKIKKIFDSVKEFAHEEHEDDGTVRKDIVNVMKKKNKSDIDINDMENKYYKISGYEKITKQDDNNDKIIINTKVIDRKGKIIKVNDFVNFVPSTFSKDISDMF